MLDELEGTVNGILNDSLAAAGVEDGDSSVKQIKIVVYATSPSPSAEIQREWNSALSDSAVYQAVVKACEIAAKIVLL